MTAAQTLAEKLALRRRAIFAACKAAGLDNDARRAIVKAITGRDSMSDCTLLQLGQVLDHLNRGNPAAPRRRVTPAADRAPLIAKIEALLRELAKVTDRPVGMKYADAIAKRNGWAECVDFADAAALKNIVAALNRTLQFKRAGN